ncbi:DUF2145 domain-containing protein [Massilia sp. DWR3-1-1]|uniref:DUF2145 domain-containing protein n=1 Tax=Massilia sp. DWR3-1-1 TaxID=2804559 RepID=UPI003CF03393
MRWRRPLALVTLLASGAASAQSGSPAFCDRLQPLSADQQDKLLRFAAIVRAELGGEAAPSEGATDGGVLVSRSGLDLSRFNIRYSHTGVAWRAATGAWSARQLYYACDEGRPRIFDQGMAGFAMGIDNPALGYVSIVRLPPAAAATLHAATLDSARALRLLASTYSATAYPFSLRYQNCNQWIAELMAAAWGDLADGDDLRERAQAWLAAAPYAPAPVLVPSRYLMWIAPLVPFVHLDDHPPAARRARQLAISLPATLESFARARWPDSERIELCHNSRQVVVHRGWTPIADGCVAADGDRVIALDDT